MSDIPQSVWKVVYIHSDAVVCVKDLQTFRTMIFFQDSQIWLDFTAIQKLTCEVLGDCQHTVDWSPHFVAVVVAGYSTCRAQSGSQRCCLTLSETPGGPVGVCC